MMMSDQYNISGLVYNNFQLLDQIEISNCWVNASLIRMSEPVLMYTHLAH